MLDLRRHGRFNIMSSVVSGGVPRKVKAVGLGRSERGQRGSVLFRSVLISLGRLRAAGYEERIDTRLSHILLGLQFLRRWCFR